MRRQQLGIGRTGETGPALIALLIANGLLFIATLLTGFAPESNWIFRHLALWPDHLAKGALHQLVTHQFLHGGIFHILINMFMLFMFGRRLENRWGSFEFLQFYLLCGVVGGLAITVSQLLTGTSTPVVGASGAVLGIIGAHAVLWPDEEIIFLLFFVIPIEMTMKSFALIMGLVSLFAGLMGSLGGIAHMAHLGGLVAGAAYAYYGDPGQQLLQTKGGWMPDISLTDTPPVEEQDRKNVTHREISRRIRELRERADVLLDDINENPQANQPEKREKLRDISRRIEALKNMR